ncbi:MAG: high-affinity iron transporter [Sphingobacteriales bacterium]|jgi:high-affinity iron transporter
MLESLIITFREAFEAALIVGIVFGFLTKTGQTDLKRTVNIAIGSAIIGSLIIAWAFNALAGGFEGKNEYIFEGITMLVTVVFLTYMIVWYAKNTNIAADLTQGLEQTKEDSKKTGIFMLVFFAILREGAETVVFLNAINQRSGSVWEPLLGAIIGIFIGIALAYLLFKGAMRFNMKKFFNITSIFLILIAAGLTAHGVHELQEAGWIPIIIEHVWDINPAVLADGSFPLLHEKGVIGSVFKSVLGYNGNPTLIEVLSYLAYLIAVYFIWIKASKRTTVKVTRPE